VGSADFGGLNWSGAQRLLRTFQGVREDNCKIPNKKRNFDKVKKCVDEIFEGGTFRSDVTVFLHRAKLEGLYRTKPEDRKLVLAYKFSLHRWS